MWKSGIGEEFKSGEGFKEPKAGGDLVVARVELTFCPLATLFVRV
jgi:hypothetical protein